MNGCWREKTTKHKDNARPRLETSVTDPTQDKKNPNTNVHQHKILGTDSGASRVPSEAGGVTRGGRD